MKIKLVKYHPEFAYSVGDEFQVSESHTKLLLDGGYAVKVKAEERQAPEKPEKKKAEK